MKNNKTTVAQNKPEKKKPPAKVEDKNKAAEITRQKKVVGSVYRGRTKCIDKETKPERNYVVVQDNGKKIAVAKLKSIKIIDENKKNAYKALVELPATRYGLELRTGVDFQVFDKNLMSGKPLILEDKDVFPEQTAKFKLVSHDLNRALVHTGRVVRQKKKKKKR